MIRAIMSIMLVTILHSGSSLLVWSVGNVQAAEKQVISFLANENGNYDIFIIDTDGTVLQRHATNTMRKSSLTCSPKDYLFAYSSNEKGSPDIYKMDIRKKAPIQLTQNAGRNIWPAWSPNGRWIAFVSDRLGNQHVYRMDADGSNVIRLTNQAGNVSPAWSPDSQSIAFGSYRGIDHSIFIMNADGGQLQHVTDIPHLWPGCSWSPDGTQIAYVAGNLSAEGVDIYSIDVDGKNMKKISDMGRGIRSGSPAWSPDGKWIAYSVVEVNAWPNPENGFKITFSDSTIYLVDSKGDDIARPLQETTGLSTHHVPVWVSEGFFSDTTFTVTPDVTKQRVTWGTLKTISTE